MDVAARNALVEANLGLVGFSVNRMRRHPLVMRLDNDDAMSCGYIALIRAAETYDVGRLSPKTNRPVKFDTYAVRCICRQLLTSGELETLIHIPAYMQNVNRTQKYHDLAHKAERVAPLTDPRNSFTPLAPEDSSVEDDDERQVESERLRGAIRRLSKRQREVIRKRFYEGKLLIEAGGEMGLTRERVRQIQVAALIELRKMLVKSGE